MTVSPACVAITDNKDYIKLTGVAQLVRGSEHKQEITAGNLADTLKAGKRILSRGLERRMYPPDSVQSGYRQCKRQDLFVV